MRKTNLYLFIICTSVLFSCADEIEIDNKVIGVDNNHKNTPVILSYFSPDSTFIIKFNSTEPAFYKEDSNTENVVLNPVVKDLTLGERYPLEHSPEYKKTYIANTRPVEGSVYQVRAEYPELGETVISAIDTVPYKSHIQSAVINFETAQEDNDWGALVTLEISPSRFQKYSYYEITTISTITDTVDFYGFPMDPTMLRPGREALSSDDYLITREDYYPSILQFVPPELIALYFRKENTNETFKVSFSYSIPHVISADLDTGEETTCLYSHSITIYLKTVSYNYFQYHVSRFKQLNSRKGDPLYGVGEPVNVYTNIENGVGIFASYTCDSIKFNYKRE